MSRSGDRVETFAMRISQDEHAKLKALAKKLAIAEAEVVRQAVNAFCLATDSPGVFRE